MKTKITFLVIFCLLLAACSRAAPATVPGVTIEKDIGDEFKLVFESNPSTGYHWEVVGGLDSKVVQLVRQYYQSNSEVTLVGGGGVDIWVFRAVGAGKATITVGYYPPSNGATEPEKTETFTVIVDAN